MNESIFKAYDVRGLYPEEINEETVWKIGYSSARLLRSLLEGYDRGQESAQSLIVGRDMRKHSPDLANSLTEGITSENGNVIDIGMVDTPQVYFAINHFNTCGGVQITASHNPAHYNGCKISGQKARPIGQDTGLLEIKHIAKTIRYRSGTGKGNITHVDLSKPYTQHVLSFLNTKIKRLKIVIDASNGMAGKWVPIIFGDLDLDIIEINFETNGEFKHEPNPLVESNLAELKARIATEKADIGICFDGDADRLMVVDENGQSIGCDLFTGLLSQYFLEKEPGATIIYDLRSSRVVAETIKNKGGTPRRERVGHSFMKKALKDAEAIFGGELSGHFYYRDSFYTDSGMITMVHLLNVLSNTDLTMSELIAPFRKYSTTGEQNFKVEDKDSAIKQLQTMFKEGETDFLDGITIQYKDWWVNCRASNTEPLLRLNIEAENDDILAEMYAKIKTILGEPVDH